MICFFEGGGIRIYIIRILAGNGLRKAGWKKITCKLSVMVYLIVPFVKEDEGRNIAYKNG